MTRLTEFALAALVVGGIVAVQMVIEPLPRLSNDRWEIPPSALLCTEGPDGVECRRPPERGWYDPRFSWDMESSIPDYWTLGSHRYRTRDLMGRRI